MTRVTYDECGSLRCMGHVSCVCIIGEAQVRASQEGGFGWLAGFGWDGMGW